MSEEKANRERIVFWPPADDNIGTPVRLRYHDGHYIPDTSGVWNFNSAVVPNKEGQDYILFGASKYGFSIINMTSGVDLRDPVEWPTGHWSWVRPLERDDFIGEAPLHYTLYMQMIKHLHSLLPEESRPDAEYWKDIPNKDKGITEDFMVDLWELCFVEHGIRTT